MNLNEKVIFLQTLVIMAHWALTFPLEIFLEYCSFQKDKVVMKKTDVDECQKY